MLVVKDGDIALLKERLAQLDLQLSKPRQSDVLIIRDLEAKRKGLLSLSPDVATVRTAGIQMETYLDIVADQKRQLAAFIKVRFQAPSCSAVTQCRRHKTWFRRRMSDLRQQR